MRILIVEEDAAARRVGSTLQSLGYDVVAITADPDEAKRLARDASPDVVLLSAAILVPVGDAPPLESVFTDVMGIPVVHLAPGTSGRTPGQAEESGYFGYVARPSDGTALRAAIEVAIYRHRLESLLAASEGRLNAILQSASAAVVATDAQGTITFANAAAELLLGRSQEGLIGESAADVLQLQVSQPRRIPDPLSDVLSSGRPLPLGAGTSIVDGKGTQRYVAGSVSAIRIRGGRPNGAVIVLTDVTTQRLAETQLEERADRYQKLFEGDTWASVVLDADGRIRDCSDSFAELLGIGSREGMQGRSFQEFLPVPLEYHYIAAKAKEGAGSAPQGRTLHRIDGAILHVLMSLSVAEGEPLTTLARVVDITAYTQRREQQEANRRLQVVARLAGGIAHELNTTLQVVRSGTELIGEDIDDPDQREIFEQVLQATERASGQVTDLLAIGQRSLLHQSVLEAGATLKKLVPALSERVGIRTLTALELPVEPLWLRGDAALLANALARLVDNAREAMPRGGTLVLGAAAVTLDPADIDPESDLRAGEYVGISVTDSGEGMSEEVLSQAMEPFFTTKPQAPGLGLSVVAGIARQQGGWLSLESEAGAGTTATICLPRSTPTSRETSTGES